MIVGFASGELPKIPANQLLLRSASAMGVYWGASFLQYEAPLMLQLTHEISQLLADGKLKPHIGQTFSLAKVRLHRYIVPALVLGFISCDRLTIRQ